MYRVQIDYKQAGNNFTRVSCWQWRPSRTELVDACRRQNQVFQSATISEIKDATNSKVNIIPSGVCFRPNRLNS